jgi:hypothetical protein
MGRRLWERIARQEPRRRGEKSEEAQRNPVRFLDTVENVRSVPKHSECVVRFAGKPMEGVV